mmetsp:Transcript_28658/g.44037  ORF Transcript_28658/g.44037 Transcript_28658/m.44037 type:complete len:534 (-) Transcript_28658:217-1818(-)
MVVLSASICTKAGKALISRQFVEMNRLRVEGLLAAFPKLVGHSKQHTFVDTDSVRYVYQPLENQMYLLLITTKSSNIVEDLGTLRLLAKVVPDVAGSLQESAINDHAFDLIFAFDEVLTAGGYKEEATLSSIRTNLQMESHEEEMHLMIKKSKEDAARDEMRRQAKVIQDRNMANLVSSAQGLAPKTSAMAGFGGGGGGDGQRPGMFQGFGSDSQPGGEMESNIYNFNKPAPPEPEEPRVKAKGMKLGGAGKKKDSLMAALAAEDNLAPFGGGKAGGFGFEAPAAPVAAPSTPITLVLEEKIAVALNREGAVDQCEVKGTLTFTANTDVGSAGVVTVNKAILNSKASNFSFATHPKVNKSNYEKTGTLSLKGDKGFPLNRGIGILRWSYSGDDAAPITINCWPEDEGSGSINVNIEFELTRKDLILNNVNIVMPLGTTDPPAMENFDGQYKHDPRNGLLCWHFDVLDASNSAGSMEFSIAGSDVDAFFPVQISFSSETLLCPIEVTGVTNSSSGAAVPNALTMSFVPDAYSCA